MDRNRSSSPFCLSVPISTNRTSNPRPSSRLRNRSPQPGESSGIFDFSAQPLTTQRFDIDLTEEKLLKLKEKISISKNNLNDCKKCFEYLSIIEELEEITNLFSRNRVKLLNSFFELYIALQDEMRKNKDLIAKHQKLVQEIDGNLEGLTERKVSNKLKSLKNEIKHKSQVISDLSAKVSNFEKYNELKKSIDISQVISKEILEKEKAMYSMQNIIKENLPEAYILTSHDPCKDCQKKQAEIENLSLEISKQKEINTNLSKNRNMFLKDCKNPAVKSMLTIKNLLVSWWENRQDTTSQLWKREGGELIQELVFSLEKLAESKVEQTGRELRSAVHKKICEVEADFMDLGFQDDRIKIIMEKFLELPYLLKPLFDLLKEYEKKELLV